MLMYANSEHTIVTGRNDGEFIPAGHPDLIGQTIAPYQRWADLAEAKAQLITEVETKAQALRVAVAGTNDATKLVVYREKYATALAALSGDQAALAALAPEATARGETPATLAALVKALGDAWRAAGLAIDAKYQAHKARIAAITTIKEAESYNIETGW